MTGDELRRLQAPLKERYRERPETALITNEACGELDFEHIACRIAKGRGDVIAGLHPAAGGDGSFTCAVDLLLESLVGCAGTTLCAVATAMGLSIRSGRIRARGVTDVRGTLGVDRMTPVGVTSIEIDIELDTDVPAEQLAKLVSLTERYCVVMQTLSSPPLVVTRIESRTSAG